MPKRIFVLVLLAILSSCGTTLNETVVTSNRIQVAKINPIIGSLTIGSSPVKGARTTSRVRTIFSDGDQSGYIEYSVKMLLDARLQNDSLNIAYFVKSIDVSVENSSQSESDLYDTVAHFVGNKITLSFDTESGASSSQIKHVLLNGILTKTTFLAGRSIVQGSWASDINVGEFTGRPSNRNALLASVSSIKAKVIGRSTYNGLPVVVLKADGEVYLGGQTIRLIGTQFVDIGSGVPVFVGFTMTGLTQNNLDLRVEIEQSIILSNTP